MAPSRLRGWPSPSARIATPPSRLRHEAIAIAADGLEVERIGRIVFDLPAQPVDLDVDRAVAGEGAVAEEGEAVDGLARRFGKGLEDPLFPFGEPDGLVVLR